MSQHDYDIANQPGAAIRADFNSVLAAIASLNSGSTAPSFTVAYMFWADTTTGLLKQRDSTNAIWITKGPLSGIGAAGITNTPQGTITSTNVQAALNELDGDIQLRALSVNAVMDGDPAGGALGGTFPNPTLAAKPKVRAFAAGGQPSVNGSTTAINFTDETYDTDNLHDNVTNNSRITAPTGALWGEFWGVGAIFTTGTTGEYESYLFKNGSFFCRGTRVVGQPGGQFVALPVVSGPIQVVAGDYFEIKVYFSSTGSDTSFTSGCFFSAEFER